MSDVRIRGASSSPAAEIVERAQRARQAVNPRPKMTLAFRCVDLASRGPEMEAFTDMLDKGREISFASFSRHVDWKPIARQMGYATEKGEPGLRLDKDYAVSFLISSHEGERVFYMVQSAIEYVFKAPGQRATLKPRSAWS